MKKATVYRDAINRKGLIAENVIITDIPDNPRVKKNGDLYKRPFEIPFGQWGYTHNQFAAMNLRKKGVISACVIYPDGTHDRNVWINVKDIVETAD